MKLINESESVIQAVSQWDEVITKCNSDNKRCR